MLYQGKQPVLKNPDIYAEIDDLPDNPTEEQIQVSLAKFLRYNLGLCFELITEYKMFPFQEIVINSWFKKDYNLFIASRGLGKSLLIAMFALLYAIFNPEAKIVIVSANFRAVKNVFSYLEKLMKGNNLIKLDFNNGMSRQPDRYVLKCANGAEIIGLPLSGDGLRGQRGKVLIIDEGLLVSKHIQETVLRPFIVGNEDLNQQAKVRDMEDRLIAEGLMGEEDRSIFEKNKMIICSSASYQFEYLYEGIYQPYIKLIQEHNGDLKDPSYSIFRTSYHIGLKHGIIQDDVIKAAEASGNQASPSIQREYWAMFTDSSGGFFNVKLVKECTVSDGDSPTVQLWGDSSCDYILAIDPSYASNKESDFFAMGVYMIDYQQKKIFQVHTYGKAGAELRDHYEYLTYILKRFNIVYIIIDSTGTDAQFIKEYNESQVAKENNQKLDFMDVDFETDEYVKEINKAKNEWNQTTRKIVYKHIFSASTNRKANEYLQSQISAKKVWFGSPITSNKSAFEKYKHFKFPFEFKNKDEKPYEIIDFIDDQDAWIPETQNQVALIQVSATSLGTMSFDLPGYCKNDRTNPNRPRKDNYTCLLLANYAAKHIFDMVTAPEENVPQSFCPMFV